MQSIAHMMPTGPADDLVHRGARRRSTRFPINGDVRVTSPVVSEGVIFNVSAGGLRLGLDRRVELGSVVDLTLRFEDEKVSRERGEVVWTRELPDGWLVGLRFVA